MLLNCSLFPARLIFGLGTMVVLFSVQGASVNLNPIADAFVTTGPANDLATNNYGAGGSVNLAAPGLSKGEFQSVLRFDTSTAKSSFDATYGAGAWSLQSVTLQLSAIAVNNAIFNTNAAGLFSVSWMANDGWTEGTGTPNAPGSVGLTYNTLQSTFISGSDQALGTFSYNGASTGSATYTLNMPSELVNDISAGDQVSLRLFAADNSVSYLFNSREFGTVANRPVLSINAVPEPGGIALLGFAGLFLLIRRIVRQ